MVITFALDEASATRGGVLALCYALGLGIPFILAGLAVTRMARTVDVIRRHQVALMRIGGAMLTAVGILLVTGLWES